MGLAGRSGPGARPTSRFAPGVERPRRRDLGRASAGRTRKASPRGAGGADPVSSSDLGAASARNSSRATSRAAAWGGELGRHRRATCSHVGSASSRRAPAAPRVGPSPGSGSGHTSAAGSGRTSATGSSRAYLGIAPCRVAGSRGISRRRWLGASGALMGCSAAGRGCTRAVRHGLGKPARECSARGPAGAIVERACCSLVVGCAQDGRAGRTGGPIVVGAVRVAKRSLRVVGPGSG